MLRETRSLGPRGTLSPVVHRRENGSMILLTRLNKQPVVVNAELIKFIERTPDTLITLVSGDRLMVLESLEDVVDRAVEYARQIRGFRVI
jgi:flagellar protein FlbD